MKLKLIHILSPISASVKLSTPMLGIPVVAALTPEYVNIEIEEIIRDQEIIVDTTVDLVAISVITASSIFGYMISQKYREIGKKVVMGGIHVSLLPDEALNFCDSVVVGEAELVWKTVIDDFIEGNLKPLYKASSLCSMNIVPNARLDLLNLENYYSRAVIHATRGCPYDCKFCSVGKIWGKSYRMRPVNKVIDEIEHMRSNGTCSNHIFFTDDNLAGNKIFLKTLINEVKELKITWSAQSNLNIANDKEILKLFESSGCIRLYIGIETISYDSAISMKKTMNDVSKYEDQIKSLKDAGIMIQTGLIVGLDEDDEHTFDQIREFAIRNKIDIPLVSILTPFIGTDLYNEMERENRIITKDWSKYDFSTVVFKPKLMSPELLQNKYDELMKDLASISFEGFLTLNNKVLTHPFSQDYSFSS